MSWNDLTLNPKVVLGYFNQPPSIDRIEIYRLVLNRDASCLEIVFEPSTFPENPSPKWPVGSNTVQITLRTIGISQLELNGWSNNIFGSLSISKVDGAISLAFEGQIKLKVICSYLDVTKVSGYCKG